MRHTAKQAIWFLTAALLLAGCSGGTQTDSKPAENTALNAEGETQGGESLQAELPSSEAETGQGEMPDAFPLLEEADLTIELLDVLDVEDGERLLLMRADNRKQEDIMVEIDHLKLNDSVLAFEHTAFYPDAETSETAEISELRDAVFALERDGGKVEKITCTVTVTSWEEDENGELIVLYEKPAEVEIPDGFVPHVVCEPTLSMRAEEQILKEDENVRVTLESLGKFVGTSSFHELEGILRVENLSEKEIPFRMDGIKVNGYSMDVYGANRGNLPPGCVFYTYFSCSDIEEMGITEIESLELQIMTSETENVGTVYGSAGGSWYPVTLAEHGTALGSTGIEIPVYEDDYVIISLTGTQNKWTEYSFSDPSGSYQWDFSFVNKTDKDLSISFEDFLVDGEPTGDDFDDMYVMLCDVGANARAKEDIWHKTEVQAPMPELAFRVQIKSPGGGMLYNYSEEYVTITKEMAAEAALPEEETE